MAEQILASSAAAGDGLELRYFVLKPRAAGPHGKASRTALEVYARIVEHESPQLAIGLLEWVRASRELRLALGDANP